jgi:hypothetical protein
MGRPIKKNYIGNPSATGKQITATAFIPGDTQVRSNAYIVRQKGTGKYIMASPSTPAVDLVTLVNGTVTAPGQANILITPWGASGSGATVTANVGLQSVSVEVAGAGPVGNNYKVGESLNVQNGTGITGNVIVDSVQVGNVAANNKGTGYDNTSYLIFSGTDWATPANVHVTTVGSTGNIQAVSIINPGVFTGATLPGSNGQNVAPTLTLGTQGSSATLNFRFDMNTVHVGPAIGNYSIIPGNPMIVATSANGGSGARVNAFWQVSTIHVTAGGTGYDVGNLVFESGAAAAVGNLTNGVLTSATVTAGGKYRGVPNVSVQHTTSTAYAAVIYDNTVKDFNGNEYHYDLAQTTRTGPGQATIQSS